MHRHEDEAQRMTWLTAPGLTSAVPSLMPRSAMRSASLSLMMSADWMTPNAM